MNELGRKKIAFFYNLTELVNIHWVRIAISLIFILFMGLILFSNGADWDLFLSNMEVERSAWVLDRAFPLWSQQICSGLNRITDPQSFGFSLIFLPVLIFGSFWGTKAIVFLSVLIGWFYLSRFLGLLGLSKLSRGREISEAFSLFFFTGNFFLWHLHAGHITFVFFSLSFLFFYYIAKAVAGKKINRIDTLSCIIGSWTFFSAPFLHAFAFFLIPFGTSLLVFLWLSVVLRIRNQTAFNVMLHFRKTLPALTPIFLGFLIASYKWFPTIVHQMHHPRRIPRDPEMYSWYELVASVFLPTWNLKFVGLFRPAPFPIWEHSSFSVNSWLLLCVVLMCVARKLWQRGRSNTQSSRTKVVSIASKLELRLSILYFLFLISFLIADHSELSSHSFFNRHVFHMGLRAAGRYQIGIQFLTLVLLTRLVSAQCISQRLTMFFLIPSGIAICALNFMSFGNVYRSLGFQYMLSLPVTSQSINIGAPSSKDGDSYNRTTFEAILKGVNVLNCAIAIDRQKTIVSRGQPMRPSLLIGKFQ